MKITGRILSATAVVLMSTSSIVAAESMDALVAAAKKEGQLTTIALPHDWCGYGEVLQGFKSKYGLEINELNPDAGSSDEIEACRSLWIDGSATFMTVLSNMIMNRAKHIAASVHHLAFASVIRCPKRSVIPSPRFALAA